MFLVFPCVPCVPLCSLCSLAFLVFPCVRAYQGCAFVAYQPTSRINITAAGAVDREFFYICSRAQGWAPPPPTPPGEGSPCSSDACSSDSVYIYIYICGLRLSTPQKNGVSFVLAELRLRLGVRLPPPGCAAPHYGPVDCPISRVVTHRPQGYLRASVECWQRVGPSMDTHVAARRNVFSPTS